MDIRQLDLNLLPIFEALLRKRSVTQAAQELGMSQSALSAALARLRSALNDALFVRAGRGLLPTPRALELAAPVNEILDQVRARLLAPQIFTPHDTQRRFALCLSDIGGYVLWPRLAALLAREAPSASLVLRRLAHTEIAAHLENGAVELAIGTYPGLPTSLYRQRLFQRRYVALVRAGHPLAGRPLTIEALAATPHAVVRLASGVHQQLDDALARQGYRRRVAVELPSHLMLPPLLEASDYISLVPSQLAIAFDRHVRLASLELPIALKPSTIHLHWHRRYHDDAGNRWLRQQIRQLYQSPADDDE